jgi:hypothetical protein
MVPLVQQCQLRQRKTKAKARWKLQFGYTSQGGERNDSKFLKQHYKAATLTARNVANHYQYKTI